MEFLCASYVNSYQVKYVIQISDKPLKSDIFLSISYIYCE